MEEGTRPHRNQDWIKNKNKERPQENLDRSEEEKINNNDKELNYENILYLIFCYIELTSILVY